MIEPVLYDHLKWAYNRLKQDSPADGIVRVAKSDIGVAAATAGFAIFGPVRLFQNLIGISRPVSATLVRRS
ncbi:MAG: hypothetical protein ACI92G_001084 [Candidatus Pelagisphaera sp.]|jgi:hypothetical protein